MEKDTIYKLLIVDDDKFLLDMYCMKFKKGNFDVHGAASGTLALVEHRAHDRPRHACDERF